MYCTHCGHQISDDSVYCSYCGNKIEIEKESKKKVEGSYTIPIELLEEKEIEEVEKDQEKVEERLEEEPKEDLKITSRELCMLFLAIGIAAAIINIVNLYMVEKNIDNISGQMIFILIFTISFLLLWRSKKIGGAIIIIFVLIKVISPIYYYIKIQEYIVGDLIIGYFIVDELFYLLIITFAITSWKELK